MLREAGPPCLNRSSAPRFHHHLQDGGGDGIHRTDAERHQNARSLSTSAKFSSPTKTGVGEKALLDVKPRVSPQKMGMTLTVRNSADTRQKPTTIGSIRLDRGRLIVVGYTLARVVSRGGAVTRAAAPSSIAAAGAVSPSITLDTILL